MTSLLLKIGGCFVMLGATALWSQTEQTEAVPAAQDGIVSTATDDRMLTPPPVSGESYPTAGSAETRSNYLRGGMTFNSAYNDNVLGGDGTPVSDISYSVWPSLALDESTPRMHWTTTYSPGFTFYQKTTSRNEADQNASIDVQYRLTQHVTVSFRDAFQKSSSVFNQPDPLAGNPVSGGAGAPAETVIAPLADSLRNTGNGGITYQFGPSSMVGANGTFTNLHYPDPSQVPGLYDSSSAGGSAFYNRRLSKKNYLGVMYQYQRLLAYPTGSESETQTHGIVMFYTVYVTPSLSFSFSGGPQYAATTAPPSPAFQAWTPMATGSFGWQGKHSSISASYSHMINAGSGLTGATHYDGGSVSLRQQVTRVLSAGVTGSYSNNKVLDSFLPGNGGHTLAGTATVQRAFGQHMNLSLGYTRLHQDYADVPLVSTNPDTNREFVSISYQFTRPLGR
jgi:hypothetical protein